MFLSIFEAGESLISADADEHMLRAYVLIFQTVRFGKGNIKGLFSDAGRYKSVFYLPRAVFSEFLFDLFRGSGFAPEFFKDGLILFLPSAL